MRSFSTVVLEVALVLTFQEIGFYARCMMEVLDQSCYLCIDSKASDRPVCSRPTFVYDLVPFVYLF